MGEGVGGVFGVGVCYAGQIGIGQTVEGTGEV